MDTDIAQRPKTKKKGLKIFGGVVGALILLIVLAGIFGDGETDEAEAAAEPTETVAVVEPEEPAEEAAAEEPTEQEVSEEPEPEPTEEAEPEATEEPEPDMTVGQRNAVRQADSYLSFMAFSRSGLIEQLEFEDYSTEDATFAVDHIEVDWDEQAALKAESYLDTMSFSRQGLIDQLLFEGFSQGQAEYGVAAVGY